MITCSFGMIRYISRLGTTIITKKAIISIMTSGNGILYRIFRTIFMKMRTIMCIRDVETNCFLWKKTPHGIQRQKTAGCRWCRSTALILTILEEVGLSEQKTTIFSFVGEKLTVCPSVVRVNLAIQTL